MVFFKIYNSILFTVSLSEILVFADAKIFFIALDLFYFYLGCLFLPYFPQVKMSTEG